MYNFDASVRYKGQVTLEGKNIAENGKIVNRKILLLQRDGWKLSILQDETIRQSDDFQYSSETETYNVRTNLVYLLNLDDFCDYIQIWYMKIRKMYSILKYQKFITICFVACIFHIKMLNFKKI